MKIVTASNGKKIVKMSKVEWQSIGKKAGWIKTAWALSDWDGEDIKEILASGPIDSNIELRRFCYWLGQQMAESKDETENEIILRYDAFAPGFKNIFQKMNFMTYIQQGKMNMLELLKKRSQIEKNPETGLGPPQIKAGEGFRG